MARTILIRFDDICPTMNFVEFEKAVALMDKYDVKPLIGVIPDCQDPDLQIDEFHADFWSYIKALRDRGYVIAMHGVNHVFDSAHKGIVNNRIGSEFAGHTYEHQIDKIKKGKEILHEHGIDTDIFFAPAHSYDVNTMKALAACGFKYISDGKSAKPYVRFGIKCLPCRAGWMPKFFDKKIVTEVFHAHEWVREDKRLGYINFKELITNHSSDIVSFDEYKNVKSGNLYVQLLNEKLFLKWEYTVKPLLRKALAFLKIAYTKNEIS